MAYMMPIEVVLLLVLLACIIMDVAHTHRDWAKKKRIQNKKGAFYRPNFHSNGCLFNLIGFLFPQMFSSFLRRVRLYNTIEQRVVRLVGGSFPLNWTDIKFKCVTCVALVPGPRGDNSNRKWTTRRRHRME